MSEPATPHRPRPECEPGMEVVRVERNEHESKADGPDRPRDVLPAQVIQETREIRRLLRLQVMRMRQTVHIGPLPPAKDYKAYEAVHPGSADRILDMAESDPAHGQQRET